MLWFIGNFFRFAVKADDGVTNYIPLREVYIAFLILFFLSTLIFVLMRGFWYILEFHDMRLRDLMDMDDRRVPTEPDHQHPLSPPEKELLKTISEKHRKDWSEGRKNEWFGQLREHNIERIVKGFGGDSMYLIRIPTYIGLLLGTTLYLMGLAISTGYVAWFLFRFYDP